MGARDVGVADDYWRDTFYNVVALMAETGSEGGPDDPPRFKRYLDRPRHPLPQQVPLRLGPLDRVLAGDPSPSPPPLRAGRADHPDTLGALLYYGYGFSRQDVGAYFGWPYHRIVPSARCFYPTELYVVTPGGGQTPAGVYHYDQLHHALVELRGGDHLGVLAAAAGARLDGAAAVAVLTSHFWKTAFRYRHYAYRLCSQEAGMVTGNLLLVAQALGLTGHVHHQYLDEAVDRLLGLAPGEERTMAIVPLYPADAAPPAVRPGSGATAAELCAAIAPLRAPYADVPKDLSLARRLYDLDRESVLRDTAEFAPPRPPAGPPPARRTGSHAPDSAPDPSPGPAPGPAPDLAVTLRGRHSGGTLFRPIPEPIDAAALTRVARHADGLTPTDIGAPPARLHLVVQHVSDLPAGIYRTDGGVLHQARELPPGRLDRHLTYGPPVLDTSTVNVLCYLIVDRDQATSRFGGRGYRIAGVAAGITAQRVCVLAAAGGLAARPLNSYDVREVRRLLAIEEESAIPVFQIALGRRTPTPQYEMPIVF
ncbi:SagB family peptide dehydrogenase [Thermopolyspora sp. NPDC052614]|uniref:SagB family peptide dehydrogenase n=1 Tax=Thermopolyspora sp. NPDC052614 TaxID=3155682 RepID=UPI00342C1308